MRRRICKPARSKLSNKRWQVDVRIWPGRSYSHETVILLNNHKEQFSIPGEGVENNHFK